MVSTILLAAGATLRPATAAKEKPPAEGRSSLEVQAVLLEMADDYIAALGEAIYVGAAGTKAEPHARVLVQSFLRNGVGAAIDIATGPNPEVGILDMAVLVSLQRWSFEKHWMPGIDGASGAKVLQRLDDAEADMWENAADVLSAEQQAEVKDLIGAWIEAHPDRMVVSLVRFDEFTDARAVPDPLDRKKASSLLRRLRDATVAVEDARLLGERLIWFAGRYPYLLGEQAELTVYRLADQPELRRLADLLEESSSLGRALAERLPEDPLAEAEAALSRVTDQAIDRAFDRLDEERTELLEDLDSRQVGLVSLLQEARETARASSDLAIELGRTVDALDRVVLRFQREPGADRASIELDDIREAAVEMGRAAQLLTLMLERANQTIESDRWEEPLQGIRGLTTGVVDRAFWRGLILIGVLLGGLALIRRIPSR